MKTDQDKDLIRQKFGSALEEAKGVRQLSEILGCSKVHLYRVKDGTHKLGFDFCRKLAEFHPEYTADQYYDECQKVNK